MLQPKDKNKTTSVITDTASVTAFPVVLKLPLELRKLRVAAYCRVSSKSDEQLSSLEHQTMYYHKYISQYPNWQLAEIFTDRMSARTMYKRQQFQQLLAQCRAGKIDLILTKSVNRFGRNTLELLQVFQELKTLNIEVYFELERIQLSDPKSMLLLTIYSSLAQSESENQSTNIKWGIRHAFRSGTSRLIIRPCYGYRQNESDNLVICEEEAPIVRQIFQWRQRGHSLRQISRFLQERNILSPTGKIKWGPETLNKLLQNENRNEYIENAAYTETARKITKE